MAWVVDLISAIQQCLEFEIRVLLDIALQSKYCDMFHIPKLCHCLSEDLGI